MAANPLSDRVVGWLAIVVVGWVIFAVIIVSLNFAKPPQRHDETLPTTIVQNVKLPALAQTNLLTQQLVTLAASKAEAYWGGTRCTSIRYDYKPLPGKTIAQATWYTTGRTSTHYLDCSITFNTDPRKVKISFYHYCAALIHEYGHLTGLGHSPNKHNIMYPILYEANTPKTCKVKVYIAGVKL